jgi:hypothetical protein
VNLTPADLDRLEALAEKATDRTGWVAVDEDTSLDDAALWAALNRATVLALVEMARGARSACHEPGCLALARLPSEFCEVHGGESPNQAQVLCDLLAAAAGRPYNQGAISFTEVEGGFDVGIGDLGQPVVPDQPGTVTPKTKLEVRDVCPRCKAPKNGDEMNERVCHCQPCDTQPYGQPPPEWSPRAHTAGFKHAKIINNIEFVPVDEAREMFSPRWIPVGERLPEEDREPVLIWHDGTAWIAFLSRAVGTFEDEWVGLDASDNFRWPLAGTHWMPRPAGPVVKR